MSRLLAVTFAAVLLAACTEVSHQSQGRPHLPEFDGPCGLLSRAEVARATGSQVEKVESGTSIKTLEKSGCLYRTDGPFEAIVVDLDRSGAQQLRARLDEEARQEHPNVEVISGLSDEAYLFGRSTLAVLEDETVIYLGTQYHQPDGLPVLRSLAELALTRL